MKFKLFGVRLCLSYPLAAGIALLLIFDPTGMAACCLAAAVCHELGHILAMKHYGTGVEKIRMSAFDVNITDVQQHKRGLKAELVICLAGVFVNFVLFLLTIAIYSWYNLYIFRYFALSNLSLCIFNALPVESLDGGNALELILQRNFSDKAVYFITLTVSLAVVIPLGLFSFMALLKSPYNFTMLFAVLYLISVIIFKRKKHITGG